MLSCLDMHAGIDYSIYPLSDSALEVKLGDRIDPLIHARVISLWRSLKQDPLLGQIDLVPAYCTLGIRFNLQQISSSGFNALLPALKDRVDALMIDEQGESRLLVIPVCYHESMAPDLLAIAQQLNRSVEEIVTLHTATEYTVYLLGFLPGFPYMGVLPESLRLPRKAQPEFVRAGTVALAGLQTGIYPTDSPGGWWQIGQTPLNLFDPHSESPCLFEPGDRIRFRSVDLDIFSDIQRMTKTKSLRSIREEGGWT